jgi:trigger factor
VNIVVTDTSPTQKTLTISGDADDLSKIKQHALELLKPKVSAAGFRKGKAPLKVVEKEIGSEALQAEVLEEAVNHLYSEGAVKEGLRVIDRPKIELKKFVPYSEIEFTATVEVVPPIKLADYTDIKKKRQTVVVTDQEVDDVIENLRTRTAEKLPVQRAVEDGDEVVIDFDGVDSAGKTVAGASGKDYPLAIGSDTFIPGFEAELIGLKPDEKKTFDIKFPKDYAHKPLASQKVTFTVSIKEVKAVNKPEVDDAFAKKVGPVDSIKALRADIKKQLQQQKEQKAEDALKDEIVGEIAEASKVEIPQILLDDQIQHLQQDFAQNLTYRGITKQEYLTQLSLTEEEWIEKEIKPQAERRVKTGLVLSEIAQQEQIGVSDEELQMRTEIMKNQYANPQMQSQLTSPEGQQDLRSRLLTEKTVNRLVDIATEN